MIRFLALVALLSGAAPAQTQSDPQTMQTLLSEVRQLRQALQTLTVTAQRSQILVFRLQTQGAVVARASNRVDDLRSRISSLQSDRRNADAQVKQMEERLSSATDLAERKRFEEVLPQTKARLESMGAAEQDLLTRQSEAQEQLRIEQAKLGTLEEQLNRLDRDLENAGRPPQ
jgi:chromosome segregation ATPase